MEKQYRFCYMEKRKEGISMKRIFVLTVAFLLSFNTVAFAEMQPSRKELDITEKKVYTESGILKIFVEGGYHLLDYRYIPERNLLIQLLDDEKYSKEKLYFEIRGESVTLGAESEAKFNLLEDEIVIAVPLKNAKNGKIILETEIGFLRKSVTEDTTFSLWLLGGDFYSDNLLAGKEDLLLREDFVWMKDNTPKKTPTEVFLKAGEKMIQFNGTEKHILAPIRRNAEGQIMVAAKDLGMVMEGAQIVGFNILWDEDSRTVTLQMGSRTISATDGSNKWQYLGYEMNAKTAPKIMEDDVMYLPLREMAGVFNYQTIQWDETTKTVRMYKS